jgi:hypothetical protein
MPLPIEFPAQAAAVVREILNSIEAEEPDTAEPLRYPMTSGLFAREL